MNAGVIATLVAVVSVGAALATLVIHLNRGLERQLGGQLDSLRGEVRELRREQANVRDRVSRLERLLEGLRDAITGRQAAAD